MPSLGLSSNMADATTPQTMTGRLVRHQNGVAKSKVLFWRDVVILKRGGILLPGQIEGWVVAALFFMM